MTIDVSSLQTFTDAQLLTLVDLAIAEHLKYGRVNSSMDQSLTRATLPELQQFKATLEQKIAAGSAPSRVKNYARRSHF